MNPKDYNKPVQEVILVSAVIYNVTTMNIQLTMPGTIFLQVLAEMTDGGVDRSVECTGSINAMISAFECVHDVISLLYPLF